MLFSIEIKQEPTEDGDVTENGQAKEEDDSKEAGELVSPWFDIDKMPTTFWKKTLLIED